MARQTRRGRGGFIFIPQKRYKAIWKVTVTNENTGVETDVTDYVLDLRINWNLGQLANCVIQLYNDFGLWVDKWSGGELVNVYARYGEDGDTEYGEYGTGRYGMTHYGYDQEYVVTNKIFSGKLDSVYFSYDASGYKTSLNCRQVPELVDIKIVEQFDNVLITDAITQIVDNYYDGILTYTGLPTTTTRFTGNFRHVTGINAFKTLADKDNMDIYIDTNNNIELFTKGSRDNTDDYVSYETNLISLAKYGIDTAKQFNRISVYGKEESNIIILKTEEDRDHQTNLWRKDLIISDSGLESMDEVQERADIELINGLNDVAEGSVSTLGMPLVKPGDGVVIQVPNCGVAGKKVLNGIRHNIGPNGFLTNLQIREKMVSLPVLFKDRIDAEDRLKPYSNLNNMTDTYTVYFTEVPPKVALGGTTLDREYLELIEGEDNGTAVFDTITTDFNIIQCELRIKTNFPQNELCTYEVSNNGGGTWSDVTPGTLHNFTTSGNQLKFKINVNGDATNRPIFEMVSILYKVESG